MDTYRRVQELEDELIATRRWLHQHAELAWQEYETTDFICGQLEALGLEVHRYDDHTGCWAMIHGGKAGPDSKTILLRADIDALPIKEETGLPYASIHENTFHGCGHDTHGAMLLTAAKVLTEMKNELPGNVKLLFQGAEEIGAGAKYCVEQGILDGVSAVYGCHITGFIEAPFISVNPGPRFAASDNFTITIQGVGCHGGMPHQGKDATVAACATVINLQSIVSRMVDPLDALVITVGNLKSGSTYNVVADTATLTGTVRTYAPEVRAGVPQKMRQVAENTAAVYGCTATVEYHMQDGPVIHNDPLMNRLAHDAVVKLLGEETLLETRPVGGSDDFSCFSERVPGIYASIGGGADYPHHHPKFSINEDSLKRGAAMHVQMAIDYLCATAK